MGREGEGCDYTNFMEDYFKDFHKKYGATVKVLSAEELRRKKVQYKSNFDKARRSDKSPVNKKKYEFTPFHRFDFNEPVFS